MRIGALRTWVVLAVLIAVATTLIAPTVDLPETVLREHHVVSHVGAEHALGKLQASFTPETTYLAADGAGMSPSALLLSQERTPVEAFRVLRC